MSDIRPSLREGREMAPPEGSEEWLAHIRADYARGDLGLRGLAEKYRIAYHRARDIVNRSGAYGPGRASHKGAARKYGGYQP